MILKTLPVVLFLLLSNVIFLQAQTAPPVEWQLCLPTSGDEEADCIRQTNDSGFIIAGNYAGGTGRVYKLNKNREIEWEDTDDYNYAGSCIEQISDGGYISATSSHFYSDIYDDDGWLTKYTSTGVVEWEISLGGNGNDAIESVKETPGGDYIIAGYTSSHNFPMTFNHGGYDYWLAKISHDGVFLWQKCYGGANDDFGRSVEIAPDGGYIVAGETSSANGNITGSHGAVDYWILKLNETGIIQWQKCFGGSLNDRAYCIIKTTDGGYFIAGATNSIDGDVTENHGMYDGWLIKIDNTGQVEWQKCIGGNDNDQLYSAVQAFDGGYAVAGITASGEMMSYHGGNADYFISKFSSTGVVEWQKCVGGNNYDCAYSIDQTFDGGYVVCGSSLSLDGDITSGGNDWGAPCIIKLQYSIVPVNLISFTARKQNNSVFLDWQTGSEINTKEFVIERSRNTTDFQMLNAVPAAGNSTIGRNYSFIDASPFNGVNYYRLKQLDKNANFVYSKTVAVNFSIKGAMVYPNPASTVITIIPASSLKTINITDADGKLVQQLKPSANNQYNISRLAKGIYSIKLLYESDYEIIWLNKN